VQKLLKDLPGEQKKLVEDLVPSVVTAATLQRVLQALLKSASRSATWRPSWRASARPRPTPSRSPHLVEHVRGRLAKQLCFQHRADDGALPIVTLSPDWEAAFNDALVGPGEDKQLALAPSKLQAFIAAVREAFDRAAQNGDAAVLLTSPTVRPYVRSLIERFRGQTPVLSQNEIHPRVKLKTVGMV
jgi:flagellar biosynthesis protein FlhA